MELIFWGLQRNPLYFGGIVQTQCFSSPVRLEKYPPILDQKKFHQKIFYFWNSVMAKYVHINFYRNRTTLAYLKNTKGATRKRPVFRTLAGQLQRTRSY